MARKDVHITLGESYMKMLTELEYLLDDSKSNILCVSLREFYDRYIDRLKQIGGDTNAQEPDRSSGE